MAGPPLPGAVFLRDGDLLVPTDLARGPWDPAAQHGGPAAGLVARAVEAEPAPAPMRVVRLTVELLRPVPVSPLAVATRITKPGRRVQLVEAEVRAGDTPVVRATALRIRTLDGTAPVDVPGGAPPGPDGARPAVRPAGALAGTGFHTDAMEIRTVAGGFDVLGPCTAWFRLTRPLVEGEEPSPLVRVACAADFGNGISAVVPFETHTFVNPDLTVHLVRPAEDEWVCLDARTELGPAGTAVARSTLYDRTGPIGWASQSLVVDPR